MKLVLIGENRAAEFLIEKNIKENKIDLDVRFDMILIEKFMKSYKFTHIKEIFYPTFD